jgi:hypothetical protein
MDRIQDVAQLLVSSWSVTAQQELERAIPTSHGIFDRALKIVWESGALPEWARESLHFVDSRIGLQCVELPSILDWAQRAELTAAPNPSYRFTVVQLSSQAARKVIRRLDTSEAEVFQVGSELRKAVELAKHEVLSGPVAEEF